MPLWPFRILRICLCLTGVAAMVAHAQTTEAEAAEPSALVAVIHDLRDEKLIPARNELLRLAPRDLHLTGEDRANLANLQLSIALQHPRDEAAEREVLQAVRLYKDVTLPASPTLKSRDKKKLEQLLAKAKSQPLPLDESGPALDVLIAAVNTLVGNKEYAPAHVILEAAQLSGSTEDRARAFMCQGLLWAEQGDAKEARVAFQKALEAKPDVSPDAVPGDWTSQARAPFDQLKKEKAEKEAAEKADGERVQREGAERGKKESPPPNTLTPWGWTVGVGAAIGSVAVVTGAVAGTGALIYHEAERDAASKGLSVDSAKNYASAQDWSRWADRFYLGGAVTLGLTGLLVIVSHPLRFDLWSAQHAVSLKVDVERGHTSLVIDGRF